MYTCTKLTSLAIFDLSGDQNCLEWGESILQDPLQMLEKHTRLALC